jgi:hypothetical protein
MSECAASSLTLDPSFDRWELHLQIAINYLARQLRNRGSAKPATPGSNR